MKSLTLKQLIWLLFCIWAGYLLLAMNFLSNDFASHPTVKHTVASMAQWIPMLDSIRAIPGVNDWVRTFYAGVWLMAPIYVYGGWATRQATCREMKKNAPMLSDSKLAFGVLTLIFCLIVALHWPIPDVNGWRDSSVAGGWIGIAHTAFFLCGLGLLTGAAIRVIYVRIRFGTVNEYSSIQNCNKNQTEGDSK